MRKWKPATLAPAPPGFCDMVEVMELFKADHVQFDIMLKTNIVPHPEIRKFKVAGQWVRRPLWRRASVEQLALIRRFSEAFQKPPAALG
jgi:hypothetical protein